MSKDMFPNKETGEEEINLTTLAIVFFLGLVVLGGLYYFFSSGNGSISGGAVVNTNSFITDIKEDYFKEHGLLNSDFSEGVIHWNSLPEGEVKLELNMKDYHSQSQSLQLECKAEPDKSCKLQYNKKEGSSFVDYDTNNLDKGVWLGTNNPKMATLNFWYKGCTMAVYLLTLDESGKFESSPLEELSNKCSDEWTFLEDSKTLHDTRAVGLEITFPPNSLLLIDDVNLVVR
ncbi:MAG: hypothetical protein Q8O13_09435 [Candidatus Omnitrophota bacterium]|nr:hypothetical protein [Candidatus Omnitrophota bacterium]